MKDCRHRGETKVLRPTKQLIAHGAARHGRIGINIRPIKETDPIAKIVSLGEAVAIETVTPGLPADRAGLRAGDAVTALGGVPTRTAKDVVRRVRVAEPGESSRSCSFVTGRRVRRASTWKPCRRRNDQGVIGPDPWTARRKPRHHARHGGPG